MSPEEKIAVGRCRLIAGQTIHDIVATCQEELIAGWNAVWLVYQAVMVPLVSLFAQLALPDSQAEPSPGKSPDGTKGTDGDVAKWQLQVETALDFFEKMRRFSVAAKKSKDVVERLYDASKHVSAYNQRILQQQQSDHAADRPHPIDPIATDRSLEFDLSEFSPTGMTSFNQHDLGQSNLFGWGLSPNGEAAMNVFWDDMMWETLPEVPEQQPGWIPGFDQFDFAINGMGDASLTGSDWEHWMNGNQHR